MGFTVNFTDNQEVDAAALNAVASDIDETAESTAFADDVLYGVDELNAITKSLITKGVSEGLSVSCDGTSVTINAGVAFFEDGKKVTVDTDGITLMRSEGTVNYVWLSNDTVTGIVSAKCTASEPAGDFVKLCEISPDGYVTMKKNIACMKNPSLLPNYIETVTLTVMAGNNYEGKTMTAEVPIGHTKMLVRGYDRLYYLQWDKNTMCISGSESGVTGTDTPIRISHETTMHIQSYADGVLTYSIYHAGTLDGTEEHLEIDFI